MESIEEEVEYDIKKGLKHVGMLYPVIQDANGQIIDGFHRLKIDPDWPVFRLPHIKTETQYALAKLIANLHRREMSREEKSTKLGEIAKATGWTAEKIAENLGMSVNWVRLYLPDRYKDQKMQKLSEKSHAVSRRKRLATSLVADKDRSESGSKRSVEPEADVDIEFEPASVTAGREYVDGFDLWFLPPSHPVANALYKYCVDKKVRWDIAVTSFMQKCLCEEGYLKEEGSLD